MLYPIGQTNKGGSVAFAKFVLSGYNAVKAVDNSIKSLSIYLMDMIIAFIVAFSTVLEKMELNGIL